MTHATSTTTVPVTSCDCVGHSTFLSSEADSPMNWRGPPNRPLRFGFSGSALPLRGLSGSVEATGGGGAPPLPGGVAATDPAVPMDTSRASRRARRCDLVSLATGCYLVSRFAVCLPHQRQYFENSTRS